MKKIIELTEENQNLRSENERKVTPMNDTEGNELEERQIERELLQEELKIKDSENIQLKEDIINKNYKIEEYEKININLKDELTRINEELETFKKVTETDHAEELKNEIVLLNQKLTEKDTIIQNNTVVMLKTK